MEPTPVAAPSNPLAADAPVDIVGTHFFEAIRTGGRAGAQALTLTHEQMAATTTKEFDKDDYDGELTRFIDKMAKELTQEPNTTIAGARVVDVKKLAAGEKLKREVEFAVIEVTVEHNGKRNSAPFFFLRTNVGWRFTLKK